MNRFTTILWDVDGTLLDFLYSQRYAIGKCFRSIGREITEEERQLYKEINDSYWKRLELGEITKEQLGMGRFETFLKKCGVEGVDVAAFRREYEEALGSVFSYLDDSLTVCRGLRGKVAQYVITNGFPQVQYNKLKLSGFADVMDGIFISEEIGVSKPQAGFFEYCLERIAERDKSKMLIVGDSLSSDIKGGVMAGIPTCWYRPEGTVNTSGYRPDYEISDLHMVEEILKG